MSAVENTEPQSPPERSNGDPVGGEHQSSEQSEQAQVAAAEASGSESEAGLDSGQDLDFGDSRMPPAEEATAPELTVVDLQAELEQSKAKAEENWERVLRMQADMENQRKRSQKDVENARKFALEAMINDLLPVRDSLEMGLAAAQEQDADPLKIIEGSELTLKMLSQAFEKYNIIEVDPINEKFDPEFHQAMSMQEVDGVDSNIVTGVLQKGYTLNDRLLRPALVMVAK